MKQFDVTGMSCAACSARVEKAVKEVPGVTECTVSLLTNSLSVNGSADEGAIIAAVERAATAPLPRAQIRRLRRKNSRINPHHSSSGGSYGR